MGLSTKYVEYCEKIFSQQNLIDSYDMAPFKLGKLKEHVRVCDGLAIGLLIIHGAVLKHSSTPKMLY